MIVGAGFGGLRAARALRRAPVRVTLVDRRNYHLFQPLLYQVATAGLSPEDIAHPVRAIFRRQRNFAFRLAEVQGVDLAGRALRTSTGALALRLADPRARRRQQLLRARRPSRRTASR